MNRDINFINLNSIFDPALRETTLSSIVDNLTHNVAHDFADHNFPTFVTRCLGVVANSMSTRKEIHLSLRAISLLMISLRDKDRSHEVYKRCLPALTRALVKFKSDTETLVMVVDCLAFVAFFGCMSPEETETVMLMIWNRVVANDDNNFVVRSREVLAWSFLLSGMEGCDISNKYWKHAISDLFDLLVKVENDDDVDGDTSAMVILAVADTVRLIFKSGFLDKFAEELGEEGETKMTERMINKLWDIAIHEDTKKEHWEAIEDVEASFNEEDDGINCSMPHILQEKFFTGLLGDAGYEEHLQNNRNLSEADYESDADDSDDESSEDQSDILRLMSSKWKQVHKRMVKSLYSSFSKDRSIWLKKQRQVRTSYKFGDGL